MNLRYSRQFGASLRKLSRPDKEAVLLAIELFSENPRAPDIHNHSLSGAMTEKRAFASPADLRVVFVERGDYQDVTLLDVGSHAQVYLR